MKWTLRTILCFWSLLILSASSGTVGSELTFPSGFRDLRMRCDGEIGRRIQAVVENWILPAQKSNPGMLEMMRLRDRTPDYENPVPWAGEFAGKHLLSMISMRRVSDDPRLDPLIREFVDELISLQDIDGYLGPFPKETRLLGAWDLWGHYHIMLGLMAWNDETGCEKSLDAAKKIGDLVCSIYLNTDRKMHEAGDTEMNLSISHAFGALFRKTRDEKYLDMLREIVRKEWEAPNAGDYLRQAVSQIPFYRQKKPRWESLHNLQALAEVYRIAGNDDYGNALLFDWNSICQNDIHNSGSFSTLEGAIGTPFREGAIETCCTVAWIAMSLDVLDLHTPNIATFDIGSTNIVDTLESATYNAVLGYLHPSGRWATYNTPMDGKREASAHSIVFQSRPGTPELNCCSVNAPRGLGMLSYWAVTPIKEEGQNGFYWNYFGPGTISWTDENGVQWKLIQKTNYPVDGNIEATIEVSEPTEATISVRIPVWAERASVAVDLGRRNNQEESDEQAEKEGIYLPLSKMWKTGDTIRLDLGMGRWTLRGDVDVDFKTSLYHGPILLAWDQSRNAKDFKDFPLLDFKTLKMTPLTGEPKTAADRHFPPMVAFEVSADGVNEPVVLCDFASAGAMGSEYRSWLPMENTGPASFSLLSPAQGILSEENPPTLRWGSAGSKMQYIYRLWEEGEEVPEYDPSLLEGIIGMEQRECSIVWRKTLDPTKIYYWNIYARALDGQLSPSRNGPWELQLSPNAVPRGTRHFRDALDGQPQPERENLSEAKTDKPFVDAPEIAGESTGWTATEDSEGKPNGAILFEPGRKGMIRYEIPSGFPNGAFTISLKFRADDLKIDRMQQIVSGWCESMDDPIRLTLQGGKISARIEAGGGFSTPETPITQGKWYAAKIVKAPDRLRLYLDGNPVGETPLAISRPTSAKTIALGGNPNYPGDESFCGAVDEFEFSDE